jgi:hypothetical protein
VCVKQIAAPQAVGSYFGGEKGSPINLLLFFRITLKPVVE